MSKAGVDFLKVKEDLMKDEEFKAEYERLKPRYELISEMIKSMQWKGSFIGFWIYGWLNK